MKSHNKNRTSLSFVKLGFVITWVVLFTLGEQSYGQLPAGYDQRPRVDTSGNIVDAHEGMLTQFGSTYYLYGTAYGRTSGLEYIPYTNRYRCYTSTDLTNWTLASSALLKQKVNNTLVDPPQGLYYLPKVIYNRTSNLYVMWYNWWNYIYGCPYLGVSTSSVPTGPFVIANHTAFTGSHDMSLLVDDDGVTAYIMYTTFPGFQNIVSQLNWDYLSLGQARTLPIQSGEGCVFFKNSGTYYALIGAQCFFCPQGASALVYECNSNPLTGNWSQPPPPNPLDINNGAVHGQQAHVAKVSTTQGNYYLWMADQWGSGPNWVIEPQLGFGGGDRGEDQQFWINLSFNNGHIQPLQTPTTKLTLVNAFGISWDDDSKVVAYPGNGGAATVLGTIRTTLGQHWYPYQKWILPLNLPLGQAYTIELQDINNINGTTLVPNQLFFNPAGFDVSVDPWVFSSTVGGSISGSVYNYGNGGYFGWITTWNGQPSHSTATLTLTNQGSQIWSDSLQMVAYLNNVGSPVVVGSRSGNWSPQQTWTVSLTNLTGGYPYSFELQDTLHNNAVIPPRSALFQVPPSGALPGGNIHQGTGGYNGWFTQWGWPPATLTLTNNGDMTSYEHLQLIAYDSMAPNTPIVVGTTTFSWAPGQTWTLPLSLLTPTHHYKFRLVDIDQSPTPIIPPCSEYMVIPSGGSLGGYLSHNPLGIGGYYGWFTQWGGEHTQPDHALLPPNNCTPCTPPVDCCNCNCNPN